jgi:DNA-directed RNA polymerase subunit RPC12/RpoP
MKCKDCGQDILQAHPQMCPYCRSKNLISEEDAPREIHEAEQLAKAGRYEDAALKFEKLDLWDKAKECRILAKRKHARSADLPTGKVGSVSIVCPHCGASKAVNPKLDEEMCSRCGTTYMIPSKVRDLVAFEEKS